MIRFTHYKDHSACSVANGLEEGGIKSSRERLLRDSFKGNMVTCMAQSMVNRAAATAAAVVAAASGSLLEVQIPPTPDLLNQNLHLQGPQMVHWYIRV